MKTAIKFFALFLAFCSLSICYAGDEEVPALIERADAEPYSNTGSQLPVFRQQLAKIIDIHDELRLFVEKQDLILTGQENSIALLSSRFNEMSFLVQFLAALLSLTWGSILYIVFVQRK